ncbi:hypothetical protein [Curtobacterium sp. S6]|uniref:hypothetical protein n=1 Tax=Curtobacterium sp. S6 TaxID=1479623 RepID=UPI0004AA2DD2|nr:hypothetical protein [Curtobacterium sp. S6]
MNQSVSSTISRRTLTRGALWAAPVVMATSAVPAYSVSQPLRYELSTSWHGRTYGFQGQCSPGFNFHPNLDFHTDISIDGAAPGFGFRAADSSPEATVTLGLIEFALAMPQGYIESLNLTHGDYRLTKQADTEYIDGSPFDVFIFRFTGRTVAQTTDYTWPGSQIKTAITTSNTCIPQEFSYYYYISAEYSTDNGFRGSDDSGWIKTDMTS